MVTNTTLGKRLSLVATACLLSVALPVGATYAQKVKDKGTGAAHTDASEIISSLTVDIPEIDAVGSNVDDDTLRAIFSGNIADNAETLAGLTAKSITIPSLTIKGSGTVEGEDRSGAFTLTDIVLTDVTDGMAASFSMAGMTMDAGELANADYGAMSAANVNIGAMLGMYGLVGSDGSDELQTIYSDFTFAGGSFETEEVSCTMGSMTAPELKARPLKLNFVEILAIAEALDSGDDPSPKQIGDLLRIYADFFTAFESAPVEFEGMSCDGVTSDGRNMEFSIAGMSMDGMRPGFYPSISMDGFSMTAEDGHFSLGNVTIKEMDLTGPIAAVEAAPEEITEDWLVANAMDLIPSFTGFSLTDIDMDVPDSDVDGERIKARVGAYDLTLGAYFNGIPTDINTSASNIVVELPKDSDDPQLQQMLDLGITSFDLGFAFDAAWNEAENTITVDDISFSGVDMGSFAISGTLINATEGLFSWDEDQTMLAAMGMAISNLKVALRDDGASDLVLTVAAKEQGTDPATMRPIFAGLAEGTIIGTLAGAAEAQKVGAAVNSFIAGKAKNLTIEMTSKTPAGLGMMDFMMAEDDPTSLIGKVNIDATAK